MADEIEKKYLIRENCKDYATEALMLLYPSVSELVSDVLQNGSRIRQGYLPLDVGKSLSWQLHMQAPFDTKEARLRDKDGKYSFTIKGSGELSRPELRTGLDKMVFEDFWLMTEGRRVEKVRSEKAYGLNCAEIDVYTDRDLVIAEIEVPTLDEAQAIVALGKDVTHDKAYKNKNLAR